MSALFVYFIKLIAVLLFMDPGNTVQKNFDRFDRSIAPLLVQRVKSYDARNVWVNESQRDKHVNWRDKNVSFHQADSYDSY